MMLATAKSIPAYAEYASRVKVVEVTADNYYGAGYQDVRSRVPWIENTVQELGWKPAVDMTTALRKVFESYEADIPAARALVENQ
jgi:hypothetical protein